MKVTLDIILNLIEEGGSLQERRRYISALGEIKDPTTIPLLISLLLSEEEEYGVRLNCASVLGRFEDKQATEPLVHALLEDDNPQVREMAAVALGRIKDPKAIPALIRSLKYEGDEDTREMCVQSLGKLRKTDPIRVEKALADAAEKETDLGVKYYLKKEIDNIRLEMLKKRNEINGNQN